MLKMSNDNDLEDVLDQHFRVKRLEFGENSGEHLTLKNSAVQLQAEIL